MKINPFVVAGLGLNAFAAIWYFSNGGYKMGCLFCAYCLSTAILIWLGVQ